MPEGTKELVVTCTDPDAHNFTHWVICGLDPKVKGLPEGMPRGRSVTEPVAAKQGLNDFEDYAYGGPYPPSGTHKYVFEIFALDKNLGLPPGAKPDEVRRALEGHVLAKGTLTTTYSAP